MPQEYHQHKSFDLPGENSCLDRSLWSSHNAVSLNNPNNEAASPAQEADAHVHGPRLPACALLPALGCEPQTSHVGKLHPQIHT